MQTPLKRSRSHPDAKPADERMMRLALREAARGVGFTSPNPAVGAVIVSPGNRVLARGCHRQAGGPHAEIEAMRALKRPAAARHATLYVTLEPCSTHGRTPPCTDAIIDAGFERVVIGAIDPNPAHAGRGMAILRAAGIQVRRGVLEDECHRLNRPFNKWIVSGMPWVIAKVALSLDGRLDRQPGEGRWLTGAAARAHAHWLRARVDAILVGAGTVRADNPRLTVRGPASQRGARQPWRVVVTRGGVLPANAHLFTDRWRERTLVFQGRESIASVLRTLGKKGVTSVLIEGGGEVLGQAFSENLVDEASFYLAPLISAGKILAVPSPAARAPFLARIVNPRYEQLGPDIHLSGEVAAGSL